MRAVMSGTVPDANAPRLDVTLSAISGGILRYGLVGMLLYLGPFKFTQTEAEAIRPLLEHSPLMGWLYLIFSVQGASNLIGSMEIAVAVLLAVRPLSPKLAAIGSVGAILIFLVTLSFLFSTPDVFQQVPDYPLPIPGMAGGFLLKDLFLLGGAVWSLGESMRAMR